MGKSEISTSSAYRILIEEKENEENVNEKKKAVGNKFRTAMKEKGKQTKGVKAKGNIENKAKKKISLAETSDTRTICVVCLEDHDEDWIQRSSYRGSAHEACSDIPERSECYICD
ncbi:hypothetical protein HHI36_014296 [Cryptolaemus montrouzieri]|uniref:Uncharacterized protein n=1 Tax=Cryptolaemus montrouzieri TaxID=559131 RepID=A0ABD2N2C4_9CUCU